MNLYGNLVLAFSLFKLNIKLLLFQYWVNIKLLLIFVFTRLNSSRVLLLNVFKHWLTAVSITFVYLYILLYYNRITNEYTRWLCHKEEILKTHICKKKQQYHALHTNKYISKYVLIYIFLTHELRRSLRPSSSSE